MHPCIHSLKYYFPDMVDMPYKAKVQRTNVYEQIVRIIEEAYVSTFNT